MYIENGDFVGIVNGIPYSSESKTDMFDFFEKYGDYGEISCIITDGIDMLKVLYGEADFNEEFEPWKHLALEAVRNYYKDLLKAKADHIIATEYCEEEF